jgi:hypothetical protein
VVLGKRPFSPYPVTPDAFGGARLCIVCLVYMLIAVLIFPIAGCAVTMKKGNHAQVE